MGLTLLSLFRPAYKSAPELAEVASWADAEPGSTEVLQRQIDFDNKVAEELGSLKLTDVEAHKFETLFARRGDDAVPPASVMSASDKSFGKRSRSESQRSASEVESDDEEDDEPRKGAPRRTILFAVGVGLLATIGMVIFLISDRLNSFEGSDHISELLESANSLTGDEFEAVETRAADLQDWFFLKHGLEHFAVPKQFADVKTVGCRVFKFDGADVAQIMAVTDKELLLYMFQPKDLGIKIRNGKWEIVEADNWVGAATGLNDICFLVAFKGSKDEMKEFLSTMGR
jgi:hypothetical protein